MKAIDELKKKLALQFRKVARPVSPIESYPRQLVITGAFPYYTDGRRHSGIDFACAPGDDFFAIASGEVIYTRQGKVGVSGASTVSIRPDVMPEIALLYKHCSPDVKKGDRVKVGDRIGEADLTGNTTGYHLHFQVNIEGRPVEPLSFLNCLQPRLQYRIMSGRWHEPVKKVFQEHNPSALNIIEG